MTSREDWLDDDLAAWSDAAITKNWWTVTNGNSSRAAELTLANGEKTHVPPDVMG